MSQFSFVSLFDKYLVASLCKIVLFLGLFLHLASIFLFKDPNCSSPYELLESSNNINPPISSNPTNLSHLLFGLLGSQKAWHFRKKYIESWWRPNVTKGYLFLDMAPNATLLPWSKNSPPYKISKNITKLVQEAQHVAPIQARMVHGIMEVLEQEHEGVRWVVMGDDDSMFFVENIVDVLEKYDHNKYYYFGAQSEYILSNFWFSFDQGFGGAGFIMSFPLAKALAQEIESCLRRYPFLNSADLITMVCIVDLGVGFTPLKGYGGAGFIMSFPLAKALAKDIESCLRRYPNFKSAHHITMACIVDLGVSFSPLKGLYQIDTRGDISGLLSSHPKAPLMSLHHFDAITPIFPSMDRTQSIEHFMKPAKFDQSRMLQKIICHHRPSNWTFSVSW
ncbi:hypothetical protein MTR67_049972, partial [Solanum verrucosum]